jgi:polysaccharide export outer membrane protein
LPKIAPDDDQPAELNLSSIPSSFVSRSAGLLLACLLVITSVPASGAAPAAASPAATPPPAGDSAPMIQLGPGDSILVEVYGQSDMTSTAYVSDDGTVPLPLIGAVQVAQLSPVGAARRIEATLREKGMLVDPHVNITVTQSRSQRVTVLGEVGSPGRYPVDARMSIFDLLAQAGGTRETSADVVYLTRAKTADGTSVEIPISLKSLRKSATGPADNAVVLQGGDTIVVPKADQFYIYGEVRTPGQYRYDDGLTIEQAVIRAGGMTTLGSKRRIDVKRRNAQGAETITRMKLDERVRPDDIINVKERVF